MKKGERGEKNKRKKGERRRKIEEREERDVFLTMWYMAARGMTGKSPGAGPRISMMCRAFLWKRERFFWW